MYSKDKSPNFGRLEGGLVTLVLLASACDLGGSRARADAAHDDGSTAVFVRGDRVVVEAEAAEFFEARVLEVTADRAKVQLLGGDSRSVAQSDMYRIDVPAAPKPGQLGICRVAPSEWLACRVLTVGSDLEVSVVGKGPKHLAPSEIIAPTSVTELNIRRQFERSKDREGLTHDLSLAGAPRAPDAWKPNPREQVLARIEHAWFSGSVIELGKRELRIQLSQGSRSTELPRADVIPAPPYLPPPRRGEFALARPFSPSDAWVAVRVESAVESEIVVRDATGARRSLTPADLVPLGR